ncbi:MAG: hypothetical protein KDJ36_06615, partial [Hyphomicrobiaceae bacterium]|nr:hypothetical protein [Hyphomicrobiaceae bacterium]
MRRLRGELVTERELRFRLQRERDAALKRVDVLARELRDAKAAREAAERELKALRRSSLGQPWRAVASVTQPVAAPPNEPA